jgi:hypothetical protein
MNDDSKRSPRGFASAAARHDAAHTGTVCAAGRPQQQKLTIKPAVTSLMTHATMPM